MKTLDDIIKKYDLIDDGIGYYHFNTNGAAPTRGKAISIVDNKVYLASHVISDINRGIRYIDWNYTPDHECKHELERLYNEFKDALSNYKKLKIKQKLLDLQDDFSQL